jgi:putative Holliday junction resolvase
MRLLGLDVGEKTIGVAVCDEEGIVATPVTTLTRKGLQKDIEQVEQTLRDADAAGIVFGLPLSLRGLEGQAARRVRALGDALSERLGCDVFYFDERFSTVAAERALLEADVSRRGRKRVVDKLAAVLILQAFLDARRRDDEARDADVADEVADDGRADDGRGGQR